MKKVVPLIIIVLIISMLLVSGCIEQSYKILDDNYKNIKKQFPIPTQTLNSKTNELYSEEQKLIGTWKIDTNVMKGSLTFNSDKTGTFSTQLRGNIIFNWKISDGKLHTDIDIYRSLEPDGIQYTIVNNGKTLVFGGMNFDKSWW